MQKNMEKKKNVKSSPDFVETTISISIKENKEK